MQGFSVGRFFIPAFKRTRQLIAVGQLAKILYLVGMVFGATAHATDGGKAAPLPAANKVMAFVGTANCSMDQLRPRIDATAKSLVTDRRTTRVIVDWPSDETHNVGMMGRPSPFIAAVEISAPRSALRGLAGVVRRDLSTTCPVDVYLVHERRLMDTRRTWPLGSPSPATKTLITQVRKAGLSLAEFNALWSGPHADLAMGWRRASGQTEGHYVQNVVLAQLGQNPPAIDGIGENDSANATTDHARELRMQTAAHAQTFSDMSKSSAFTAREVILKD